MRITTRPFAQSSAIFYLLLASLISGGCSTIRIHSPTDLAKATAAQTRFQAAAVTKTVVAERKRLDEVLAAELELVREHTLARRDARLLLFISEAGTDKDAAWEFLTDDIQNRVNELLPTTTANPPAENRFSIYLEKQAEMSVFLKELESRAMQWQTRLKTNNKLPALNCPLTIALDPDVFGKIDVIIYNAYKQACRDYLTAGDTGTSRNQAAIEAMIEARNEVKATASKLRTAYNNAKKEYGKAPTDSTKKTRFELAAKKLADFAKEFENLEEKLNAETLTEPLMMALKKAKDELSPLLLDGVVDNLRGSAALAELDAKLQDKHEKLLAATRGLVSPLGDFGAAVSADEKPAPLAELLIEVEQLRLEQLSAKNSIAFYDRTLQLLAEQQEAESLELAHLGEAERLRRELIEKSEVIDPRRPKDKRTCLEVVEFSEFFTTPAATQRCRERVFRLLVAYSNSWELGRVKQEQIRYRLIGLHHQSALDSAELAFAKWQNLIGVPIDRLVAYYETGLKVEDILPLINALGLGAIAVGVN